MKLENDEKKLKGMQEHKEKFSKTLDQVLNDQKYPYHSAFPFCSSTALIYYCTGERKELTSPSSLSISLGDLLCCPSLFCGVRREESFALNVSLGLQAQVYLSQQKLTLSSMHKITGNAIAYLKTLP